MALSSRPNLPLLETDVLRTFIAIADTGSFTTAGEVVFRTPSAVSMQIKKLEEMLGVPVFRRDARSVSLTPHGEMLLSYARRMIALNNEAVARFVSPEMNGVVRLGAPDDIGELMLPGILRHLSETWPNLAVEVTIDNSTHLRRAVEEGRLDLTLFNFLHGIAPDPALKVMTEDLVWAGKRHGHAHLKDPVPISVWEEGCVWRKQALDALTAAEKPFRVAYFCAHHMGQIAAIRADIAIAPLARFLLQDDMVALDERDGLPKLGTYDIGLVTREGATQPVQAVAEYVRCVLGDRSVLDSVKAAA
ncbi:LysR family transcriptional regulator [Rhizobium sp. SG2393]|uniref:LysR family transcriptional regulator n=1 Tax=Rhizobium sp. SG2393 TaxID=3276279 RepID=UPI0036707801